MSNALRLLAKLACSFTVVVASLCTFANRTPMYQASNYTWYDFFYTVDFNTWQSAINQYGYSNAGQPFWVEGSPVPGAVPFSRFYKGSPQTDHFYTIFPDEISSVTGMGWASEGSEGYLYGSQVPGSVPVYRLSHWDRVTSNLMHYYTVNSNEIPGLQNGGWGYDKIAGYAFQGPGSPAVQPRVVHATQVAATCADKYCVRMYGFRLAADAWIEVHRDSQDGPVMGQIFGLSHGVSGEGDFVEFLVTDQAMRDKLASASEGLWFTLVNPGDPPGWNGGFQVVRDSTASMYNAIDIFDSGRLAGWVCATTDFSYPMWVTAHVGSDTGPGFTFRANINRPDVAQYGPCGGYGNHAFDLTWPSAWKDGQTREIYLTALLPPPDDSRRFPNVLLYGLPRTIAFPNVPWDSSILSVTPPGVMQMGGVARTTIGFRNTGSGSWSSGQVSLVPINSSNWQVSSVPLPQSIVRSDENVSFAFDVRAPLAEGVYNFAWQLNRLGTAFGAMAQSSVRVLQPPNVYPSVTFPATFQ